MNGMELAFFLMGSMYGFLEGLVFCIPLAAVFALVAWARRTKMSPTVTPSMAAPIIGGVLFLVLWAYVFHLSQEIDRLESLGQQVDKLKDDYLSKKKAAVNVDLHREQVREIEMRSGQGLRTMPKRFGREFVEVVTAAHGHGLTVQEFRRGEDAVLREFYAEEWADIRLRGSFHDFKAFVSSLNDIPGAVVLSGFSVEAGTPLSMQARMRSFRYLDDEEIAAQRKAARKAAPFKK